MFYCSKESVERDGKKLKPRFKNAVRIPDTRKYYAYFPTSEVGKLEVKRFSSSEISETKSVI